MMRPALVALALFTAAAAWLGPLPDLATRRFSAHMTLHMSVVAVVAPLLALGLARGPFDPSRRWPVLFSAIPVSLIELVVVWCWHAPAFHHAARGSVSALVAEQGSFLLSGFLVWMSAFGGGAGQARSRAGAGVVALLLTSMHMTLLGALIALAPRPLYVHDALASAPTMLEEQHLGGAIMLLVGGVSYLAGALWLSIALLRSAPALDREERAW